MLRWNTILATVFLFGHNTCQEDKNTFLVLLGYPEHNVQTIMIGRRIPTNKIPEDSRNNYRSETDNRNINNKIELEINQDYTIHNNNKLFRKDKTNPNKILKHDDGEKLILRQLSSYINQENKEQLTKLYGPDYVNNEEFKKNVETRQQLVQDYIGNILADKLVKAQANKINKHGVEDIDSIKLNILNILTDWYAKENEIEANLDYQEYNNDKDLEPKQGIIAVDRKGELSNQHLEDIKDKGKVKKNKKKSKTQSVVKDTSHKSKDKSSKRIKEDKTPIYDIVQSSEVSDSFEPPINAKFKYYTGQPNYASGNLNIDSGKPNMASWKQNIASGKENVASGTTNFVNYEPIRNEIQASSKEDANNNSNSFSSMVMTWIKDQFGFANNEFSKKYKSNDERSYTTLTWINDILEKVLERLYNIIEKDESNKRQDLTLRSIDYDYDKFAV